MFDLDKCATRKNLRDVVNALGKVTDTMSKVILQNRKDIKTLVSKIKELEDKKNWMINKWN